MANNQVTQTVIGNQNIVVGMGNVYVTNPIPLSSSEWEDRRNLAALRDKVNQFWVTGVLFKSVHHTVLLEVNKATRPGAVDHPWEQVLELPDQTSRTFPPRTQIGSIFNEVNHALLILGAPGSGKTITLLELAHELITCIEKDDTFSQPIPVVFNLSTWKEGKLLFDWLVEELSNKYQIHPRISGSWLKCNRLLPLLDGLDEVKADERAACVQAINVFFHEFGLPGLVVCSRLEEYISLPTHLKLNGAICLQPLNLQQIDDYLTAVGNELIGLRTALPQNQTLQELAQSPLMLSIMSLAYRSISAQDLLDANTGVVEHHYHLFDTYITGMFNRKGTRDKPYTDHNTRKYLAWLAQQMQSHNQSILLIDQMQPTWLSIHLQGFYKFGLLLVILVIIGLMSWFMKLDDERWVLKLLFAGCLAGWLVWPGQINSVEKLKLSKENVIQGLLIGAMTMGGLALIAFIPWSFMNLTGLDILLTMLEQWPLTAWLDASFGSTFTTLFVLSSFVGVCFLLDRVIKWLSRRIGEGFSILIVLMTIGGFSIVRIWLSSDVRNKLLSNLMILPPVILIGALIGLACGLVFGLTYERVEVKVNPNQGIRQSMWNSLLVGPVGAVVGGVIVGILGMLLGSGLFSTDYWIMDWQKRDLVQFITEL